MSDAFVGQINPNLQVPELGRSTSLSKTEDGPNFSSVLKDAISTANELQKQSDQQIQRLMTGESQDLHTTLIAVQKADLSFQMMMQVRNKIVQAYQEIMRMQI
jgi:flagellar hook-basal body complex protein FliE